MLTLQLQRQTRTPNQPKHTMLQGWLNAAWADSAIRADAPQKLAANNNIALCIVGARAGKQFNLNYRNKDYATNVLSFPNIQNPEFFAQNPEMQDYLGDLIICAPIVNAEAIAQNKDLTAHWAHLCVHGFLHLLGFDHIDDSEAEIMENHERRLLQKLGFADPYAEIV